MWIDRVLATRLEKPEIAAVRAVEQGAPECLAEYWLLRTQLREQAEELAVVLSGLDSVLGEAEAGSTHHTGAATRLRRRIAELLGEKEDARLSARDGSIWVSDRPTILSWRADAGRRFEGVRVRAPSPITTVWSGRPETGVRLAEVRVSADEWLVSLPKIEATGRQQRLTLTICCTEPAMVQAWLH